MSIFLISSIILVFIIFDNMIMPTNNQIWKLSNAFKVEWL